MSKAAAVTTGERQGVFSQRLFDLVCTHSNHTLPPQSKIFGLASTSVADYLAARMSGARKADDVKIVKELIVINKLGIHARPAALFVKTANQFDCEVFVEKDGETVNGKSIMGLMMLAAGPGSRLVIYANGADAAGAVVEIEALVQRKFDED